MNRVIKLFHSHNKYFFRGRNSNGAILVRRESDWNKGPRHCRLVPLEEISPSDIESFN